MSTEPTPEPTPPEQAPQQPTQPPEENKADRGGHVDQVITIRGRMR